MRRAWKSLRVQLAVVGFVAIYVPVLLLFGVVFVTERENVENIDGVVVISDASTSWSPWVPWTVVALGPAAGALAWWWAGRAVSPIARIREVAEDIGATDLGRRIGLEHGPTEIVSLAASFDGMLGRLQRAADTQRQLIEETSHELRTPLAVLATNAEVLLAHPEPTLDVYRDGLVRSGAAAERLRVTIDELLVDARGRARAIDRQPADLMAMARDVVDDARVLAARKEIAISVAGPPAAVCSLDESTVRRAVSNLVDNAIMNAPVGSAVRVDVEMTPVDARVLVTDHGPGIPSDEQDHVFERFWRGRVAAPGTGLGLPIARHIALAHGGSLTVTSPGPDGDGCMFDLRLRR